MLLAQRRVALIHLCLAGMEAAWFTPFWLLIFGPQLPPLRVWLLAALAILAWIGVLDLLSRTPLESPAYDLVALGLMLASSTAIVLIVTAGRPELAFRYGAGFPLGLALAAGNLFLWQRATAATSRELTFFKVGFSFRLGLLLLIASGAVAMGLQGGDLRPLLWLYLGCGLTAVSAARIHEKAEDSQSAGAPLPGRRVVQLLTTVGLTVAGAALLAQLYTRAGISAAFHLLDPLWRVVGAVLEVVLTVIGWALNPILMWLESLLYVLLRQMRLNEVMEQLQIPAFATQAQDGLLSRLPDWAQTLLTRLGIGLAALVVIAVVLVILLLCLDKVTRRGERRGDETAAGEDVTLGGGILGRGLAALREMLGLARRYGLSRQLLAAVSVQNIYANLCRLARARGYGRRPAQPPDRYLPELAQAFPGEDERLARLTAAYMAVHYGDLALTREELTALRADYRAVREAELGQHQAISAAGGVK
jgi:hypothetical protein